MTRSEFTAWRRSAATEAVMAMLQAQVDKAQAAWLTGQVTDPTVQAKAGNMAWLIGLTWDDLNAYYGWEQEDEDTEDGEDSP